MVAFLSLPLAASAQSAPAAPAVSAPAPAHHHHKSRYMHALKQLNLSADQKAQIKGFSQTARTANENADPATKKANMQKLHAQIDGVLTPAQRDQLKAALAKAGPATAPAK
jgi:Spy/CpxP family protein refolding chaperone